MKKIEKFKSFECVVTSPYPPYYIEYILDKKNYVEINSELKEDLIDVIKSLHDIKMFDNEKNALKIKFTNFGACQCITIKFSISENILYIKLPDLIFDEISENLLSYSENDLIEKIIDLLENELTNIENYIEFLNSEVI